MILDKKQMTEEDIKLQFITPAIQSQWGLDRITMETRITDGRISLKGNLAVREKPKKADYVLYLAPNKPIAIVEAKDNHHSVSHGLQQAITYARMQDIPFAYSSNGDAFQEHDLLTGLERTLPLDAFPTAAELAARWESASHGGAGLSPDEKKIVSQPYYSSQNTHEPRYYQRNAINRAVEAIARGQKRLLLVMATGTGKTYTAFQIVYRLLKGGLVRKVLYLADRNNLVEQSIQQDFAPLEKTIHRVNFAKEDPATITSHEVYFSLYQQLAGDEETGDEGGGEEAVARFARLFKPDFFDLVIVDECHRGSAKQDRTWRRILEYFSSATQIGMTATPKETRYVSNIDYFGAPVYAYSLREGIEDGFLAPFKVINVKTDISDGWRPCLGQRDKFGNPIEDRIYTNSDFDYNLVLEDRTQEVAREITAYLKSTGRMQKTIVFCANEEHAERMRTALNNLNADMAKENPDYVVRITGSGVYGKKKLKYFISVAAPYPVIATTSKLLSTGADCKMVKLIVLDEMIGSMTEFKQIIGRGTRLREKEGKSHFVVMDFRNVTRLFADPDWDGPVEQEDGFGEPIPGESPQALRESAAPRQIRRRRKRLRRPHHRQARRNLRHRRQAPPPGKHRRLHQNQHPRQIRLPRQLHPPLDLRGQEGCHPRPPPRTGHRPRPDESRAGHDRRRRLRLHLPRRFRAEAPDPPRARRKRPQARLPLPLRRRRPPSPRSPPRQIQGRRHLRNRKDRNPPARPLPQIRQAIENRALLRRPRRLLQGPPRTRGGNLRRWSLRNCGIVK